MRPRMRNGQSIACVTGAGRPIIGGMIFPQIAAVLFGLGAVIGAWMAVVRLRGGEPPVRLAIGHGLLVGPGLVIVLLGLALQSAAHSRRNEPLFDHPAEVLLAIACALFILAAAGGLFMFTRHLRQRTVPRIFVAGHGLTAVTAYTLLLIALFTQ